VLFLRILILFVLSLIFLQDIGKKSVYWFLFPVLTMLFCLMHFLGHRLFVDTWQPVLINIIFLVFQFLIVTTYFSIKNRHWVNISTGLLGWGDMLFLLSIAFYLSAFNFLLFYIVSLISVLLIWLFWQLISKEKDKQIPLAGLQAFIFIVFLAGDWWCKFFDLTNDAWLLNLVAK
jgi:hypothetical protein